MSFLDRPTIEGKQNSGRVPELNRPAAQYTIPEHPLYGEEGQNIFSRQALVGIHGKTVLNQAFSAKIILIIFRMNYVMVSTRKLVLPLIINP